MPSTLTRKPNRYAGTCENCNRHVEANDGYLVGKSHRNGPWLIAHTDCGASDATVRGHIAAAREAITPSSPYDRDLNAMTVRELELLLDGVIDTHACQSEVDNCFDRGSAEEARHMAGQARIAEYAREIEAVIAGRTEAA